MKNTELIGQLQKLPEDYDVLIDGEYGAEEIVRLTQIDRFKEIILRKE